MADPRDQRAARTLVTLGLVPDDAPLLDLLDSGTWHEALSAVGVVGDDAADALEVVEALHTPLADDVVTPAAEGRYAFLLDLGEGGMGRVRLASDAHLHRQVALKELLVAHPAMELRFLREARVTAQLEHPGIVPVYELGRRDDGTLYYTMKEVRGNTLRDALDATTGLDDRLALLGILVDVCQAVGYAHSKGVVHRDLKPENVMIGAFGETTVVDWGLAKVADEPDLDLPSGLAVGSGTSSDLTRAGTVMGTPKYMSPEQAAGRLEDVDARSDVWAVGVMLYELLTGDVPFDGSSNSVLHQVQQGVWLPPDSLEKNAPPELVAICIKCLERAAEHRYPDAGEVARELEAWRTGAAVGAHTYGTVERMQRIAGRFKVTLIGMLGLAIGVTAGWMAREDKVDDLQTTSDHAQAQLDLMAQLLRAETVARSGAPSIGLALARDALAHEGPHQDHARELADALRPTGDARVLTEARAYQLAWTPTGKRLAWAEQDGVVIADPVSGSELGRIPTSGYARAFALTPDEGRLWVAVSDQVFGTDLSDLTEVGRFTADPTIQALYADAEGLRALTETGWQRLAWDGTSKGPASAPSSPQTGSYAAGQVGFGTHRFPLGFTPSVVTPSPDGTTLAAGGEGGVWLFSLVPTRTVLSNLRKCPDGRVVPVLPFPRANDLEPPARSCAE